jgi:hypothetical protein
MDRHVHRRPDAIVVICTRWSCAPLWRRKLVARALLVAAPFLVVAGARPLGPARCAAALCLLAVVAAATWGTLALGARIECDAGIGSSRRSAAIPTRHEGGACRTRAVSSRERASAAAEASRSLLRTAPPFLR